MSQPQQHQHCETHDEHARSLRDLWAAVSALRGRVSNHDGRWVILGIILVAGLGWVGYAVNIIGASTERTATAVAGIDKSVAAYMASNTERLNQLVDRIDRIEEEIHDMRGQ